MRTPSFIAKSARVFAALPALVALLPAIAGAGLPEAGETLVYATLVADVDAVAPGQSFLAGVRLDIAEGWHVNWINPGDAGLAPGVKWNFPDSFTVEPIRWPFPGRYVTGTLAIFGYSRSVLLVSRVTPPATLAEGASVSFSADIDWLACNESCVPGNASVSLALPVSPVALVSANTAAFAANENAYAAATGRWHVSAWLDGADDIVLEVRGPEIPVASKIYFFPYEPGITDNVRHQRVENAMRAAGGTGFLLRVPRGSMVRAEPDRLSGVLVSSVGWGNAGVPAAFEFDVPLRKTR